MYSKKYNYKVYELNEYSYNINFKGLEMYNKCMWNEINRRSKIDIQGIVYKMIQDSTIKYPFY